MGDYYTSQQKFQPNIDQSIRHELEKPKYEKRQTDV